MLNSMYSFLIILVLALLSASTFFILLIRKKPMWLMLLLLLFPVLLALSDVNFQTMSNHGLMHASIVYELSQHGVPPGNPLLAGERLYYPYGHHFLISKLMNYISIAPGQWFVITNIISLILFIWILERIARLISPDRTYRALAVFVSVVGCNPFAQGPLRDPFLMLSLINEHRIVPLSKFLNINSNPLGLLCFVITFWGLVRLVTTGKGNLLTYAMVAIGSISAAFLYPIVWPGILVCIGLTIIYLWYIKAPYCYRTGGYLLVILVVGIALVIPWLLSITEGKSATAAIQIIPSKWHLLRNGIIIATLMALPVGLALFMRTTIADVFRAHQKIVVYCLLCAISLQGMYLLIFFPLHAEYKYLAMSEVPIALILAFLLQKLVERQKLLAAVLIFLLALPANWNVWGKIVQGFGTAADPALIEGNLIIHQEPAQRELYRWIRENTERDAVFVDTYLTVPPFAQRQLFVGLDTRRDSGDLKGRDGWSMTAKTILELVNGSDQKVLERRRHLAENLLLATNKISPRFCLIS